MSAEDEQGFVIRDRRGRSDEPAASDSKPSAAASQRPSPGAGDAGPSRSAPSMDHAQHEAGPPVSFATFVYSLGTSALMLMGEQLDPRQGKMPVSLPQAKEIIDILSILEEKTRGNLSADEQAVLTDMLYALRMKYVDMTSAAH